MKRLTFAKQEIQKERARSREEFGSLFDDVAAFLFVDDPMGINFEENTDEYEAEAATILPRFYACTNVEDVHRVVVEEFGRWFSPEIIAPARYRQVSSQIWAAWGSAKLNKA